MEIDYTHLSKTYDNYRPFPDQLLRRVVELGSIGEGTRVLDLGCGTGQAAVRIAETRKADVIGVDKSSAMLNKARSQGVRAVCADADRRALPFRGSSFDVVIGIYVIHHIRDLAGLFLECRRILRDGTIMLLTSSHAQIEAQHPTVKQFFPSFVKIDMGRFPDIPVVNRLLERAGFDAVEHEEISIDRIPLDETHLEKVKNKFISTYELIPEDEFRSGVMKLEAYIKGLREPEFREWRATLIKAVKRSAGSGCARSNGGSNG